MIASLALKRGGMALAVLSLFAIVFSACGNSSSASTSVAATPFVPAKYNFPAVAGFTTTVFAAGTTTYYAPDAVEVDNGHVFIDYQNTTAKDCTDTNSSTIVEYTMDGQVVKQFTIPGHSDGMRADPTTHLLWVTSCEDGNPKFVTVDTNSGTITPYTIPATPHGGGLDDLYFLNGKTFMAASNPSLNAAGVNVFPALYEVALGTGKLTMTPVLMGDGKATDLTTGANNAQISLNEVDPDSLSVDTKGNLVLINQGGNEIVYLTNPGTPQQKVSRLAVGSQLDDTVWATTPKGRLLVTDGTLNVTFWVNANYFDPSYAYTELPDDSGVVGLIGKVDLGTGLVTPIIIGLAKPTGMLWVPSN